jgi:aspartyl-tRNA(Asn)/glutamyl-tRNA(Gln) amidotransferase subunit A
MLSLNRSELDRLTVAELSQLMHRREAKAEEVVRGFLTRIHELEPRLFAWAMIDPERAIASARAADQTAANLRSELPPLHGIPFGVKDVIDVAGLPTQAGFKPYSDRVPQRSAPIVVTMEKAGAIVLGKTVTTQFAFSDPATTRNPWSDSHTPGGSSSGSAVAVSARQVPVAVGTQTGGSILRPAAFTGIVGLKPTKRWIAMDGVIPVSWTLDHVGLLTSNVLDAQLVFSAISGQPAITARRRVPRIGVVAPALDICSPSISESFRSGVDRLKTAGAHVQDVAFKYEWKLMQSVHRIIMQSEASAVHFDSVRKYGESYLPRLKAFVIAGRFIPAALYLQALKLRSLIAQDIAKSLTNLDVLLLPTVAAPAPGRETTGDSSLQSVFTLVGAPTCTLPCGLSADGLPLGLQLVGHGSADCSLLRVAAWCEDVLGSLRVPPGC